ncbi:hypothetical protein [Mucilaginibacter sp.]
MKCIKFNLIFPAILLFCNCNTHEVKTYNKKPREEGIVFPTKKDSIQTDSFQTHKSSNGRRLSIEGKWKGISDSSATISVSGEEIFYYDIGAGYNYSFKHDTIKILFDDYDYQGVISKLGKNTMIMNGLGKFADQIDTFVRVKH